MDKILNLLQNKEAFSKVRVTQQLGSIYNKKNANR